jgi:uncharacterized protein YaeQ
MRQNFDISINDYNRDLFTAFKTVLDMREGESPAHVLLKAVAAALFFQPGIQIEPVGDDPQYRPDLLVTAEDGRPSLWIECGQVRTVKLDKLTSRYGETQFIVVKKTRREANDIFGRAEKEVRRFQNLSYVGFDPNFIDTAANNVMGKNDCIAIISDATLQFIINGAEYSTQVHTFRHAPPKYSGKSYV